MIMIIVTLYQRFIVISPLPNVRERNHSVANIFGLNIFNAAYKVYEIVDNRNHTLLTTLNLVILSILWM